MKQSAIRYQHLLRAILLMVVEQVVQHFLFVMIERIISNKFRFNLALAVSVSEPMESPDETEETRIARLIEGTNLFNVKLQMKSMRIEM